MAPKCTNTLDWTIAIYITGESVCEPQKAVSKYWVLALLVGHTMRSNEYAVCGLAKLVCNLEEEHPKISVNFDLEKL